MAHTAATDPLALTPIWPIPQTQSSLNLPLLQFYLLSQGNWKSWACMQSHYPRGDNKVVQATSGDTQDGVMCQRDHHNTSPHLACHPPAAVERTAPLISESTPH